MMRIGQRLWQWSWIAAAMALVAMPASAAPCAGEAPARRLALAALPAHGDLVFDGAVTAMIPGLARADGPEAARAREALLTLWRGRDFALHRLPRSDRWGREVAIVLDDTGGDVAEKLLLAGAALFEPERAPPGCAEIWRAAERRARLEKRGVWRGEGAPLRDAANPGQGATGRFLLLQGRVTSVGERPRRVYLNFGPPGSGAATVSMQSRLWRDLAQQGMTAQSLKGRRILVRGIPDAINGRIMLDLTNAAAIELDP